MTGKVQNASAKSKGIRLSKSDRIYYAVVYSIVVLLTLLVLYPLIYVLSASFSSGRAVASGKVVLLPVEFSTYGYQSVLNYQSIWIGYRNTFFLHVFWHVHQYHRHITVRISAFPQGTAWPGLFHIYILFYHDFLRRHDSKLSAYKKPGHYEHGLGAAVAGSHERL